jgi:hypothetical protein
MTTHPQLMTASLKVFRCGPRRDDGCHKMVARVDKPRKEEAAGVLVRSMGKECWWSMRRRGQRFGWLCACRAK